MEVISATSRWYLFPFRVFFAVSRMRAITISSSLAVAVDQAGADDEYLRIHEYVHMRQFREHGWGWFVLRYFWLGLRHGYVNNPFEVEARRVSREWRAANARFR